MSEHDKLARRLAVMLVRLNDGQSLNLRDLAEEFGVNLRTLQRDVNQRLGYLPLEKTPGGYRLDPAYLGRLQPRDIERFAALSGVRGLFPKLGEDFIRDLLAEHFANSILVRGHHYEDLSGFESQFDSLQSCISGQRECSFRYQKGADTKVYSRVQPYRLLNHKGIWYLLAIDRDRLKSFSFTRISAVLPSESRFDRIPEFDRQIQTDEGIWSSPSATTVVILVAAPVADFFRRRPLIANQQIVHEHPDGSLKIEAQVGHQNQVLPHVRYWIPHLRIVSPEAWANELKSDLSRYLQDMPW